MIPPATAIVQHATPLASSITTELERAGLATREIPAWAPVPDYRYELRRGEEVIATGHLSRAEPLAVGERPAPTSPPRPGKPR